MNKRIYLSPPDMCGEELKFVNKAFDANWIAPVGPDIDAFENDMCEYVNISSAVALSSGTAALHLALKIAGVSAGDYVLCSSFTFAGSAFPISYLQAKPIFIDSDYTSWNMDPKLFEYALNELRKKNIYPKACIIVHLYGMCADLESILEICRKYDIIPIEDAAESLGARYKNKFTGTFTPFGIFSFNGNKIITTSGGGMLVSSNKKNIEQAKYLSTQARDNVSYYRHTEIGYNYRMSNILAAIGRGQLCVINDKIKKKRLIFEKYKELFRAVKGIVFMPELPDTYGNRWLTCITIDPQKVGFTNHQLLAAFEKEDIEARLLWKPMHQQPVFKDCLNYNRGVSDDLFDKGLCLPSGSSLNNEEFAKISITLLSFLNNH